MAIENAASINQKDSTFKVPDMDAALRHDAPMLAPLMESRSNMNTIDKNLGNAQVGNLTIDGESKAESPNGGDLSVNKTITAQMAHDALLRAELKNDAEKMLNAANKSESVQKGEGYFQVLQRMNPDMKPDELHKLALEVKAVNGNNHVLHRGGQFEMLSPEQKKQVVDNIMNDYDRAHGMKGLNDTQMDPVVAKMANAIRSQVERSLEPEFMKSFEKAKPPVDESKPDAPAKPSETDKPDASKTSEVPFTDRVRLAVESCQDKYHDVDHAAKLAEYVSKRFAPESQQYQWAMKNLSEDMKQERHALDELHKLAQVHPEDRELTRQLQKDLMSFTKQQVRIMKALHTTDIVSPEDKSA